MNDKQQIQDWLNALADRLIQRVQAGPITEGTVLCTGPAPYRRLDCQGRALAYVRARPRKRSVRIDITGLWKAPPRSRLLVPAAGGAATLMIRSESDLEDAVRFIRKTVERTIGPIPRTPSVRLVVEHSA